jgi:anti-anti-sigma factor
MKRHLTLSTTSHYAENGDAQDAMMANGTGTVAVAAHARPGLELVPTRPWRHTLILKGNLDCRSTSDLEEELECLRQEGVTTLTLDLNQLDAIDASGARLIATRGASWKRLGRHFAVLPGSDSAHRALAEAGATDLLAPKPTESVGRRISSRPSDGGFADLSTTMVADLGLD